MSDDRYVKLLLTSVAGFLMVVTGAAMLFFTGEALVGVVRGLGRVLLLAIPLLLAAGAAIWTVASFARRRIWERDEAARALEAAAAKSDPVAIARAEAPELLPEVEGAMASIAALRRLPPLDMAVVAEALALADGRLPSLIGRHVAAVTGATDEERRYIARRTLSGVLIIGRTCEEARAAAVAALGDDVETETRYLAARTGDGALGA